MWVLWQTAAESRIRDTDMASEMVRFSNNQILLPEARSLRTLAQAPKAGFQLVVAIEHQ